jgi:hypothetical protein
LAGESGVKRVIISRSTQNELSGRDLNEYLAYLREQYNDYRFMTYDVLLNEARIAYAGFGNLLDVDGGAEAADASTPGERA